MDCFASMLVGAIIGFVVGIVVSVSLYNSVIALKLSNVMNASMLDCVTHKIITKGQVHDIETIFHRHIEYNFGHLKAGHDDNHDNCKNKRIKIESNYSKTI